jgi:hypothetical protein
MFGVVLWSDEQENKAVIWCEDQGDLAFYRQPETDCGMALDAGDLVQFDLTVDQNFRLAQNPRLVAEGYHPGLADALNDRRRPIENRATPRLRGERLSAQIIPFRARPGTRAHPSEQSAACPA